MAPCDCRLRVVMIAGLVILFVVAACSFATLPLLRQRKIPQGEEHFRRRLRGERTQLAEKKTNWRKRAMRMCPPGITICRRQRERQRAASVDASLAIAALAEDEARRFSAEAAVRAEQVAQEREKKTAVAEEEIQLGRREFSNFMSRRTGRLPPWQEKLEAAKARRAEVVSRDARRRERIQASEAAQGLSDAKALALAMKIEPFGNRDPREVMSEARAASKLATLPMALHNSRAWEDGREDDADTKGKRLSLSEERERRRAWLVDHWDQMNGLRK